MVKWSLTHPYNQYNKSIESLYYFDVTPDDSRAFTENTMAGTDVTITK